jgi:hypothetical protein
MEEQMKWRRVVPAVLIAGALAGGVAPMAHAQERDGCYGTRGGSMGCIETVRSFNFVDPVLDDTGNWRMRGRVYVVWPDMHMVEVNPEGWPNLQRQWVAGTGR